MRKVFVEDSKVVKEMFEGNKKICEFYEDLKMNATFFKKNLKNQVLIWKTQTTWSEKFGDDLDLKLIQGLKINFRFIKKI